MVPGGTAPACDLRNFRDPATNCCLCRGARAEIAGLLRSPILSDHFASDDPTTFDPAAAPDTVVLKVDHMRLRLAWHDGKAAELGAARLRAACRCAWCTRARIDGTFAASFDGVTIEQLAPIGGYAINILFTDGHGRGIYPWAYLHKLARGPDAVTTAAASGAAQGLQHHDGPSA